MKKTIQRLKNERGLTLVELLAVIVILAIIAVIAFVFIGGIIENSKKDAHIANAQQIIAAAKLYDTTSTSSTTNLDVSISKLQDEKYLEEVIDPWDKKSYDKTKVLDVVKVQKDDTGYKISNYRPNDTSKCKQFTAYETELAEKGRSLCE